MGGWVNVLVFSKEFLPHENSPLYGTCTNGEAGAYSPSDGVMSVITKRRSSLLNHGTV